MPAANEVAVTRRDIAQCWLHVRPPSGRVWHLTKFWGSAEPWSLCSSMWDGNLCRQCRQLHCTALQSVL